MFNASLDFSYYKTQQLRRLLSVLTLFLAVLSCKPAMQRSAVAFSDGTKLEDVQGRIDIQSFVYNNGNGKVSVDYDSIAFIEQYHYYDGEPLLYRTIAKENSDSNYPLRVLLIGENIELYAQEVISGGQFGGSVFYYYSRKDKSQKLKYFGPYSTLTNNLGQKLKNYFSDCPELLEKMESKEFRVRSDVIKMFQFYESNCGKQ